MERTIICEYYRLLMSININKHIYIIYIQNAEAPGGELVIILNESLLVPISLLS